MQNYFKKTLAGIFAVALVASSISLAPYTKVFDSISITASALETDDGLEYEIVDNSITITGYSGTSPDVVIPSKIGDTPVTVIGELAFYGTGIQTIVLNEGLTKIENDAFWQTPITSVTFPKSLSYIGTGAFFECENLRVVRFLDYCEFGWENNVSPFLDYEYGGYGCYLNTVYCPTGSQDYYFSECFLDCDSNDEGQLWTFIEEGPASEKDFEFDADTGTITSYKGNGGKVEIPSTIGGVTVTAIGDSAFYRCDSLTGLVIPDSVTSIGNKAFSCCTELAEVNIPEGVTCINKETFSYCYALETVIIPDSVKSIGDDAFNLSGIKNVTIPDSVTSIGEYAFAQCKNLENIVIPASVTDIGNYVFRKSEKLKTVTFECDDEDVIKNINPNKNYVIFSGCSGLEKIYIPEGCAEAYKNSVGYGWLLYDEATKDLVTEKLTVAPKGYSASYNGNVMINFHYAVSDEYKNGCLKFGDGTTISVNDAAVDGNGYYVFPISMPAKNMYDEITAQFCNGSGYAVGKTVTFKMSDYLSAVKEAAPNAACAEFVDNFLEYGAQAANYFNVSGAPTAKTYTDADYNAVITALAAYENAKIDDDTFVGATLLLKSTPKLRLYYSEPFTDSKQNELNPALFYIEKEVAPTKFGTEDLNDYLVYNYIYKAMNSNDESLKAICTALYNMSKAIPAVG